MTGAGDQGRGDQGNGPTPGVLQKKGEQSHASVFIQAIVFFDHHLYRDLLLFCNSRDGAGEGKSNRLQDS